MDTQPPVTKTLAELLDDWRYGPLDAFRQHTAPPVECLGLAFEPDDADPDTAHQEE